MTDISGDGEVGVAGTWPSHEFQSWMIQLEKELRVPKVRPMPKYPWFYMVFDEQRVETLTNPPAQITWDEFEANLVAPEMEVPWAKSGVLPVSLLLLLFFFYQGTAD